MVACSQVAVFRVILPMLPCLAEGHNWPGNNYPLSDDLITKLYFLRSKYVKR